ncbi:MAG: trypsin-like peptidase domain-containing protein [Chloroflexota bacterium]
MKSLSNHLLIVSLVLMLLALSLGSGCQFIPALSPPQAPASPPPPAENITAPTNPAWVAPELSGQGPSLPNFGPLVARVRPAVVAINTEIVSLDFFNQPFTEQTAGSGWIIDENGYIVTNNHVVEGAQTITVTLDDRRSLKAKVVGADSLSDIAVLQINAPNLVKLPIGDTTKEQVGGWVIAIGNALGLGISATNGIISALDVSLPAAPGQTVDDLIQTDAAINPGNSGGPLVNMKGEVIGINSIKISQTGVEGMGYAISMRTALPVIQDLIRRGYVTRPFLGVSLRDVDQFLMLRFNLPVDQGALVIEVVAHSPAASAGLEAGDVITNLNDTEIISSGQLIQTLHRFDIGETVTLTYYRGNRQMTGRAQLVESPPP